MKKISFLHCADLHLDSPMKGLKYLPENVFGRLQESTFRALSKIVDLAMTKEVQFVVIAGDVFDLENRSLRVQARFRREMERLNEKGVEVYLVHGNHDHLSGKWTKMKWPENVHVFADQVEVMAFQGKDGTTANLYGFSYPERHVTERWIDKYKKKANADFHIGILHGHFEGASDHGNYAPFRLADLLEKQFDYWALGHIHKRAELCEAPPVIYPGNPQGRNRKESGSKGCYHVTLTESGAEYEFYETNDVIWQEKILDGSVATDFDHLYELCMEAIEEIRTENKAVVLSLQLQNLQNEEIEASELLEVLQDQEKLETDFVWVREVQWQVANQLDRSQLLSQGEFFQELFTAIDEFDSWEEALSPLYHHNTARKHLTKPTEEEKEQLLQAAETKLLALLSND